jgi:hypothetical protein
LIGLHLNQLLKDQIASENSQENTQINSVIHEVVHIAAIQSNKELYKENDETRLQC